MRGPWADEIDVRLRGEAALGHFNAVRSYFDDRGTLREGIGMLPHWLEQPPVQVLLDRAFQFACRAGYLDIAKFLAQRGADIRSVTPANSSSLDEARKNGHQHIIVWLGGLFSR